MKQLKPKPILTIKVKCSRCWINNIWVTNPKCKSCKGTGSQDTEIYALRDFEKRKKGCGKKISILWNFGSKIAVKCGFQEVGFEPNFCDECTGYKIPFKDYEIKMVSEITKEEIMGTKNLSYYQWDVKAYFKNEHNIKETDKLVMVRK